MTDCNEVMIREYLPKDLTEMIEIWNEVVEEGNAFPQEDLLNEKTAVEFFASQSFTGVAELNDRIVGLYILHSNNIGRCGHLSNGSFAVRSTIRGKRIGEQMVRHALRKGKEIGFRVLQFNAVVKTNNAAIRLYEQLGFVRLGVIPEGFRMKDGHYEDIILFYHTL